MPIQLRKKQEGEPAPKGVGVGLEIEPLPQSRVEQALAPEPTTSFAEVPPAVPTVVQPPVALPSPEKSGRIVQVEQVLSQGLAEVFKGLNPQQQIAFKEQGEALAEQLAQAMEKVGSFARKAYRAIRKWLDSLPNVSRAFVVQESKIKTDQLLLLLEKKDS